MRAATAPTCRGGGHGAARSALPHWEGPPRLDRPPPRYPAVSCSFVHAPTSLPSGLLGWGYGGGHYSPLGSPRPLPPRQRPGSRGHAAAAGRDDLAEKFVIRTGKQILPRDAQRRQETPLCRSGGHRLLPTPEGQQRLQTEADRPRAAAARAAGPSRHSRLRRRRLAREAESAAAAARGRHRAPPGGRGQNGAAAGRVGHVAPARGAQPPPRRQPSQIEGASTYLAPGSLPRSRQPHLGPRLGFIAQKQEAAAFHQAHGAEQGPLSSCATARTVRRSLLRVAFFTSRFFPVPKTTPR